MERTPEEVVGQGKRYSETDERHLHELHETHAISLSKMIKTKI